MPVAVHNCALKDDKRTSSVLNTVRPTAHGWFKRQLLKMFMVSSSHPRTALFFKSPVEIKHEKMRQLTLNNPWIIHPLSEFRLYYEIWLCFLYAWALIQKPIDAAFSSGKELFPGFRAISLACDVLCWIDILITFKTGYINVKKQMELTCRKIFWHYVLGPFFICDVISSLPKTLICLEFIEDSSDPFVGTVNLIFYFKVARLITLLSIMKIVEEYWDIQQSLILISLKSLAGLSMVIHYMGCLQITLPRSLGRHFQWLDTEQSWIYHFSLINSPFGMRYIHAYFRAAAYIFGVRIKDTYTLTINIDYELLIFHYFIGKFLMAAICVILAVTILNLKNPKIKYEEVLNELEEFMKIKSLPLQVREKFLKYYKYKYQKKYVNEKLILGLLPTSLKDEINRHLCKTLVEKLYIFSTLNTHTINQIISKLITEIYLPGDTIFTSGSFGEALYFIANGTVAVYTHSGKEVFHLEDGSYFGEVSLIFHQRNSISVLAIELTTIYKLHRKYFNKYVTRNKLLYEEIKATAEARKILVSEIEEQYKKKLFAEEFGGGQPSLSLSREPSVESYELSSKAKAV